MPDPVDVIVAARVEEGRVFRAANPEFADWLVVSSGVAGVEFALEGHVVRERIWLSGARFGRHATAVREAIAARLLKRRSAAEDRQIMDELSDFLTALLDLPRTGTGCE